MRSTIISLTLLLTFQSLPLIAEDLFIDGVVASVNGEPIMLSELSAVLNSQDRLKSLSEASKNPEARYALDTLIMKKLIAAEAEQRKVYVSEEEISAYLSEISTKNGMSEEEFQQAIQSEYGNFQQYRSQIRMEILKTKLAAEMLQGGVGVTDDEVDRYLENHSTLGKSGSQIKLRQILLSTEIFSKTQAEEQFQQITEALDDGETFEYLAREYSQSPEAKDGGLIGVVAEEDLNPTIFDAIFELKEGEHSTMVESPAGFHMFFLEQRFVKEDNDRGLRTEIRKTLQQQKLESRMHAYFSNELFEKHGVEKNI